MDPSLRKRSRRRCVCCPRQAVGQAPVKDRPAAMCSTLCFSRARKRLGRASSLNLGIAAEACPSWPCERIRFIDPRAAIKPQIMCWLQSKVG